MLAQPKGPLMALTMADAIAVIIPKTRARAKVFSHLWPTSFRLRPRLSEIPVFSIRSAGNARENIIVNIIPGTTSAISPATTMTPTTKLNTQIRTNFDMAKRIDAPRSACPFTISSDAILTAPPTATGENTAATIRLRTTRGIRTPKNPGSQFRNC